MSLETSKIYEFGPFQASVVERVLRRDGAIVPLTPKCFDTLLVLVESSGNVVEKERLIRAVWPDTFVEEGNLAQNIFSLRKALGGTPEGAQYIQTIPKRGYRLTVPVTEAGAVARQPEGAIVPSAVPPRPTRRISVALAAILAAGSTLIAARWVLPPAELLPSHLRFTPLAVPNQIAFGVISPDGKQVAYVAHQEAEGQSLWIRQTEGVGVGTRLIPPQPGHFWGVSFSPNQEYLYFVFEDDLHPMGGVLFRIRAGGGQPEKLLVGAAGAPSFTPDGGRILVSRGDTAGHFELVSATAAGTQPKVIGTSNASYPFNNFQWSADGKNIYYVEGTRNSGGSAWSTLEIPAVGGPAKVVMLSPRPLRSVYWLGRSDILALIPDEDSGARQMWRLRTGRSPIRLTNDTIEYLFFTVTADSQTLLANKQETEDSIWAAPAPGVSHQEPVPMSLPAGSYDTPVWAPDGRVVYVGQSNLWLATPDGSERRPLIPESVVASEPTVSSDGHSVVFVLRRHGMVNLWRTGIDGGGLRQVTTGRLDLHPAISADGHWVLYTSEVQGKWGIWKAPLDGSGSPVRFADSDWYGPVLSPDGKLVAYFDSAIDPVRIQVRSFNDGSLVGRITPQPDASNLEWSRDGKALTYLSHADRSAQLWTQRVAGGSPERIGEPLPKDVLQINWSADRSRIVYLRRELKTEFALMTGFR